ncbi:hypothetical protein [Chelatococcus sp. XZ-Ab1]|uniref:hypothetical protein n=1 Tax=Chelatococcus sp. XZ-Ab1 TaxID=3034027 RepID=UPI0023E3962B|nr:hypothetical protein [Chelatococcus sp. XZ-Ab1]
MDDPSDVPPGWESRRERRLWLIAYVAMVIVVGLGAARQFHKLYGRPGPASTAVTDTR